MALGCGHSSPLRGHVRGTRRRLHSAGPPRRLGTLRADERDLPHGENISPAPTFLQARRPTPDTRRADGVVGACRRHLSPTPQRTPCSFTPMIECDVAECPQDEMRRHTTAAGIFREVIPHHGRSSPLMPEHCLEPWNCATHRLYEVTSAGISHPLLINIFHVIFWLSLQKWPHLFLGNGRVTSLTLSVIGVFIPFLFFDQFHVYGISWVLFDHKCD